MEMSQQFLNLAREQKWKELREQFTDNPSLIWTSFDENGLSCAYWAALHGNIKILDTMFDTLKEHCTDGDVYSTIYFVFVCTKHGLMLRSIPKKFPEWTGDEEELRRFCTKLDLQALYAL